MPVFRLCSSFFRLAAAAVLACAVVVSAQAPAQAQVALGPGYPGAWGYYAALSYYTYPYAIAFPGYAHPGGWLFSSGLRGAAGRLSLR
ncbi:MAG TPA: hypothetical protein VJ770_13645 [Stellaceae bacterium]|nr:hypothetical protein [Stellaceae bacterium]